MAAKIEEWWSNYHQYSIKDYASMPVFKKFLGSHTPHSRQEDTYQEASWTVDNCWIFEWFDTFSQNGEKFGHDKNSNTYFYEKWDIEEGVHKVFKTWLSSQREWGEVIKFYSEHQDWVFWSIEGSARSYEEFSRKESEVKGIKNKTVNGVEDFTEMFWEQAGSKGLEKIWNKGESQRGESRYEEQDHLWGKDWVKEPHFTDQKEWHLQGSKKWGTYQGESGAVAWNEAWNRDSGYDFEDKNWTQGDNKWGFTTEKSVSWNWKLEWQGYKPLVSSKALTKELANLYFKQKELIESNNLTLTQLLELAPEFQEEVDTLKNLVSQEDPSLENPFLVLEKLHKYQSLASAQENVKKKLIFSARNCSVNSSDIHSLIDYFETIISNLSSPTDANHSILNHKFMDLKRTKTSLNTLEESLGLVKEFAKLCTSYSQLSSHYEFDSENPEITSGPSSQLSNYYSTLALSKTTLEKTMNFLADSSEYFPVVKGLDSRLQEIKLRLDSNENSKSLMNSIQGLLEDFEHLKTELLSKGTAPKQTSISKKHKSKVKSSTTKDSTQLAFSVLDSSYKTLSSLVKNSNELTSLSSLKHKVKEKVQTQALSECSDLLEFLGTLETQKQAILSESKYSMAVLKKLLKLTSNLCSVLQKEVPAEVTKIMSEKPSDLHSTHQATSQTLKALTSIVSSHQSTQESLKTYFGCDQEKLTETITGTLEKLKTLEREKSLDLNELISKKEAKLGETNQLSEMKKVAETSPADSSIPQLVAAIHKKLYIEKTTKRLKKDDSFLKQVQEEVYEALKVSFKGLLKLASDLSPNDFFDSLKSNIEAGGPLLGLTQQLEDEKTQLLQKPFESLKLIHQTITEEAEVDNKETDSVFSALMRLLGSSEDKQEFKALKKQRSIRTSEPDSFWRYLQVIESNLQNFLGSRSKETLLQKKLLNQSELLAEKVEEIDQQAQELFSKLLRQVSNFTSSEKLNDLKPCFEEEGRLNTLEVLNRVLDKLTKLDKLANIQQKVFEDSLKQICDLKIDIQEKEDEIQTNYSNFDSQKANLEAQIENLEITAHKNSVMLQNLTQESRKKEQELFKTKKNLHDLRNQNETLKSKCSDLTGQVEELNRNIRALKKSNKEKNAKIREMETSIEDFEREVSKNFEGNQESTQVLEELRKQTKDLKNKLAYKESLVDELESKLHKAEAEFQDKASEASKLSLKVNKLKIEKKSLEENILRLEQVNEELEEELKAKDSEKTNQDDEEQLKTVLEDKELAIEELQEQLQSMSRFQNLYYSLREEKHYDQSSIQTLKYETSELHTKNNYLSDQLDKQKAQLLQKYQTKLFKLKQENLELSNQVKHLKELSQSASVVQEMGQKLTACELKIKELEKTIDCLTQEHSKLETRHRVSMHRNFLIRFCNALKNQTRSSFTKWKQAKSLEESEPVTDFEPFTTEAISYSEAAQKPFHQAADKILAEESLKTLKNNPLVLKLKSKLLKEKPMSFTNLFNFLEGFLDSKFESDSKPVVTYLMQYATKVFGLESIATRNLAKVLGGLKKLYQSGHEYSKFFCRLFQVFDPCPAPDQLGLFLVEASVQFKNLVQKSNRNKEIDFGTGGVASLAEVIELIVSSLDKESASLCLDLVKPETMSLEGYLAYRICWTITNKGLTPNYLFSILDKDQNEAVTVQAIQSGLKEDLDLWVSETSLTEFLKGIADSQGTISKTDLLSRINLENFIKESQDLVVPKSKYLLSLSEVFISKRRNHVASLYEKFSQLSYDAVNLQKFTKLVLQVESSTPFWRIEELYKESAGSKGMSADAFCKLALKHGLGGSNFIKTQSPKKASQGLSLDLSLIQARSPQDSFSARESLGLGEPRTTKVVRRHIARRTSKKF